MQGVNALAEIASSLPDFIGGASRNDDGGQTSSRFFSGEPRRDTRNDVREPRAFWSGPAMDHGLSTMDISTND